MASSSSPRSTLQTLYTLCITRQREGDVDAARFRAWGAELRVADGHLDRALRRSSSLRHIVEKHLANLASLTALPQGSENEESNAEIKQIIDRLADLSPLLKSPRHSDDLKRLKRDIMSDADTKADIAQVAYNFPQADKRLQRRLGIMNRLRRFRFSDIEEAQQRRWQALLHSKLISGKATPGLVLMDEGSGSNVFSELRDELQSNSAFTMSESPSSPYSGVLDESLEDFSSSVVQDRIPESAPPQFPPLPEFMRLDNTAPCPFCKEQEFPEWNDELWRAHVIEDLEPFVCTFGGCSQSYKTFDNCEEWWNHEISKHGPISVWLCHTCGKSFESALLFELHMKSDHGDTFSPAQLPEIVKFCKRDTSEARTSCPLCRKQLDDDETWVLRHIGKHLEDIALYSLPTSEEDKGDDNKGDESDEYEIPPPLWDLSQPRILKPAESRFSATELLTLGPFAVVDKVRDKISSSVYARKSWKESPHVESVLDSLVREVKVLGKLRNSHIVSVVGIYFTTEVPRTTCMLMVPAAESNLQYILELPQIYENRTQFPVTKWIGCLTSALAYLHQQGVRHRNIKPSSIMIRNNHVFLGGFGLSSLDSEMQGPDSLDDPSMVTQRYAAPELLAGDELRASDIFSLGCVFFEIHNFILGADLEDFWAWNESAAVTLYDTQRYSDCISQMHGWLKGLGPRDESVDRRYLLHFNDAVQAIRVWVIVMTGQDIKSRFTAIGLLTAIVEKHHQMLQAHLARPPLLGKCSLRADFPVQVDEILHRRDISSAKRTLRDIIQNKLIFPKGTYKYRPIELSDEIRVLVIQSGKWDNTIQCKLVPSALGLRSRPTTSREDAYDYEALSYWWGDDDARTKIMILSSGSSDSGSSFNSSQYSSLYIRQNLFAALQQLRSETRDVAVWVDALCINQANSKEKTVQVSRMHEIYTEANSVCIWLGAGIPERNRETFVFLNAILNLTYYDSLLEEPGNPENQKWRLVGELLRNKWFSRRWVIQDLALARDATVHLGAESMQWRDFSDAIAIYMEGYERIRRSLMTGYSTWNKSLIDPRASGANSLINVTNNLFRKSDDGAILQRLLTLEILVTCLLQPFEASDPRDTIYAVLSIAKDTSSAPTDVKRRLSWLEPSQTPFARVHALFGILRIIMLYLVVAVVGWHKEIPSTGSKTSLVDGYQLKIDARISPDYTKDLLEVYTDFIDYCIETSQSLDILCRHWATPPRQTPLQILTSGRSKSEEKMPTWIPSIKGHAYGSPEGALSGRLIGDSIVGESLARHKQQNYDTSAGLRPWYEFERSEKWANDKETEDTLPRRKLTGTLLIKGFVLSVVENMSPRVSGGVIPCEALELGGWEEGREATRVPDPLWRTLVADRGPGGTNVPVWYHRACLETLMHVDVSGDLNFYDLKKVKGTPQIIRLFLERVECVVWNRRFFQSQPMLKLPYFGLAPPNARIGDLICILYGCSVPVLLRKLQDAERTYFEFVGECYVHGMMDGEAIPNPPPMFPYDNDRNSQIFNLR